MQSPVTILTENFYPSALSAYAFVTHQIHTVISETKNLECVLYDFICSLFYVQVNVFGFGADSRGNWHHYWEQNRYSGEFRKTGVHDADYEAQIIKHLAKAGKITVFPGK